MKQRLRTRNFFLIHTHLVRQGYYESARWLLRKVIEGSRPNIIWHGLGDDSAWHVSGITDGNGYNIRLTY